MIGVVLMLPETGQCQTVLMEQDVNADTTVPKFGRNRTHFVGSFVGAGIMLGQAEGDSSIGLRNGRSAAYSYGQYYKFKVSKSYSMLFSATYRYSRYEFELGDQQKYNRLILNEIMGEFVHRLNFGKRGNYIGNYVEAGFSGDYSVQNMIKIKTKNNDVDLPYQRKKEMIINLNYLQKFNYSGHVRLGFNKFVIGADYRLSDLVNDKASYDLPPLILSLRFDMGA